MQGEYWTYSCEDMVGVHQIVTMLQPREIILHKTTPFIDQVAQSLATQPNTIVSYRDMLDDPTSFLTQMLRIQSIQSFGQALAEQRVVPFALLLHYLSTTQQQQISTVYRVSYYRPGDFVLLDDVSIKNLEIFASSYSQDEQYSLFGVLNRCQTTAGSKLLRQILAQPLKNASHIAQRQQHIAKRYDHTDQAQRLIQQLGQLYDLPRLLTRIIYKQPHFQSFQRLRTTLAILLQDEFMQALLDVDPNLHRKSISHVQSLIKKVIKPDESLDMWSTEYIRDGYDSTVDELRQLIHHTDQILLSYHNQLITHLNCPEIKLIFVTNQGYVIEATPKHIATVEAGRVV